MIKKFTNLRIKKQPLEGRFKVANFSKVLAIQYFTAISLTDITKELRRTGMALSCILNVESLPKGCGYRVWYKNEPNESGEVCDDQHI